MLDMDDDVPGPGPDLSRVPPHSLDAERAALGSILIAPRMYAEVRALLEVDDFFLPAHREIFDAMIAIAALEKPIDVISLMDVLKARGVLDRFEGKEGYLLALLDAVPTAENAIYYAGVVSAKAQGRRLIAVCAEAISRAYGQHAEIQDLIDDHAGQIMRIANRMTSDLSTIQATVNTSLDVFERRDDKVITGVSLGNKVVDRFTGGIQRCQYTVIAARPGVGKTAWALGIARDHCRARAGNATLFVSLEQTRAEIVERLYCMDSPMDSEKLKRGLVDYEGWKRIHGAASRLRDDKLYIVEDHFTMARIESVAQRFVSRHPDMDEDGTPPRNLFVLDYIQLVNTQRRRGELDAQAIGQVSHEIKRMLKKLRLPGIVVCQLNRESEKENRSPRMSDLRQSGDIEQDADLILFPHNPKRNPYAEVEVILAKNKNGKIGAAPARWEARHYRFSDVEHEVPDQPQGDER